MRIEYINPFIEASESVFKEMLGLSEIRRGELSLKSDNTNTLGFAAFVGLAGGVEGRVILDMALSTALEITSVLNGESFTEMNEENSSLIISTMGEIVNIVSGRVITRLSELGYSFDISPPLIIYGEGALIRDAQQNNLEFLTVPFILPQGLVEINIAIRERL